MLYYTGIGSRRTPDHILELMENLARWLAHDNWILRSGHATGADQAFERGASMRAEIFLPWSNFESSTPINAAVVFDTPTSEAYNIAARYHPGWERLSNGGRALHARNVHQILGPAIEESQKSTCVICWTSNGTLTGEHRGSGGTGQAIRIARSLNINVINLAREEHYAMANEKISEWVRSA